MLTSWAVYADSVDAWLILDTNLCYETRQAVSKKPSHTESAVWTHHLKTNRIDLIAVIYI